MKGRYLQAHFVIAAIITLVVGVGTASPGLGYLAGSGFYFLREIYQAWKKGPPINTKQHFIDWFAAHAGAILAAWALTL